MSSEQHGHDTRGAELLLDQFYNAVNRDDIERLKREYEALTGELPPPEGGDKLDLASKSRQPTPDYYSGGTQDERDYNNAVDPSQMRDAARRIADKEFRRRGGF